MAAPRPWAATFQLLCLVLAQLALLALGDRFGGGRGIAIRDARLEKGTPLGEALRKHVIDRPSVCGGPEIREMLRPQKSDLPSIKTIPWEIILKQADTHISDTTLQIRKLESDLVTLATRLKNRRADEIAALPKGDIDDLITKAVTESYGSVKDAEAGKCGLSGQDRFTEAQDAFKAKVSKVLVGTFRTTREEVQGACYALLVPGGKPVSTDESYCDELCDHFAEVAAAVSQATAGTGQVGGPTYRNLLAEVEQVKLLLEHAQADLAACEEVRGDLAELRTELERLREAMDEQFKRVRAARNKLTAAEQDLERASKALEAQQTKTLDLEDSLMHSNQIISGMEKNLLVQKEHEKALSHAVADQLEKLKALHASLEAAGAAVHKVQEFKGALTLTLRNMAQIYNDAVSTPIRKRLGISEESDFSDWPDPSEVASRQDVTSSTKALADFCALADTKQALEGAPQVQVGAVGLPAVCGEQLARWQENADEIVSLVREKRARVLEVLRELVSFLDENKGSGVDASHLPAKLLGGEPEGLRKVVSLFKTSKFYKDYADGWLLAGDPSSDEPHVLLKLFQMLEKARDQLEVEEAEADKGYRKLQEEHAAAEEAKEKMIQEMNAAVAQRNLTSAALQEAKALLGKWESDVAFLKQQKETLNTHWVEAKAAYDKAKEDLINAHAVVRGSLLQLGFAPSMLQISANAVTKRAVEPHEGLFAFPFPS